MNLPVIKKLVRREGEKRATCMKPAHIPETETLTWARRKYWARVHQQDFKLCNNPAYHTVEGMPMCRNHAGQVALRALEL